MSVVMKIWLMCKNSRPQVYSKVDVLKIYRKTSALESFFNKVVGRRSQAYNFIKEETPAQVEIFKIVKNTFFTEQLWTTTCGDIRILTTINFQYQS